LIALLLLLIYIVYRIYKSKRPLTKFGHFYDKSFYLEEKKEYEKALDLRKQALELDTLTNLERAELYLANARMYLRLKQYKKATDYFDISFELAKEEKFPYSKGFFDEVVEAYLQANRKKDAIELVNKMLERQSYDKKFKKLQSIKEKLKSV
jgi:tetratricopeptide (TPR) repeat protein